MGEVVQFGLGGGYGGSTFLVMGGGGLRVGGVGGGLGRGLFGGGGSHGCGVLCVGCVVKEHDLNPQNSGFPMRALF